MTADDEEFARDTIIASSALRRIRASLGDEMTDGQDEATLLVLDLLSGWCAPRQRIRPPTRAGRG